MSTVPKCVNANSDKDFKAKSFETCRPIVGIPYSRGFSRSSLSATKTRRSNSSMLGALATKDQL